MVWLAVEVMVLEEVCELDIVTVVDPERERREVGVEDGHLDVEGRMDVVAAGVEDGDTVDGQRRRWTSTKDQNFMKRGKN